MTDQVESSASQKNDSDLLKEVIEGLPEELQPLMESAKRKAQRDNALPESTIRRPRGHDAMYKEERSCLSKD